MIACNEFSQNSANTGEFRAESGRDWAELKVAEKQDDLTKPAPKDPEIRFRVTKRVWEYLEWVSRHSVLGEHPNDIAERVLLERLAAMRQEDYKPPEKL